MHASLDIDFSDRDIDFLEKNNILTETQSKEIRAGNLEEAGFSSTTILGLVEDNKRTELNKFRGSSSTLFEAIQGLNGQVNRTTSASDSSSDLASEVPEYLLRTAARAEGLRSGMVSYNKNLIDAIKMGASEDELLAATNNGATRSFDEPFSSLEDSQMRLQTEIDTFFRRETSNLTGLLRDSSSAHDREFVAKVYLGINTALGAVGGLSFGSAGASTLFKVGSSTFRVD